MAKTPKAFIPQQPDELTPDWFTDTLRRGATVTAVDTETIGTGIGFLGEIHRCRLRWDRDEPDLPASVIVKTPSERAENRALGEGLGAFEREIDVYRRFAGELGLPMPVHHYSALDPNPAPALEKVILFLFEKLPVGGVNWLALKLLDLAPKVFRRYLLVIEDIADARPPTQAEGGSLEDSRAALVALARFHATNWMRRDRIEASDRILPFNTAPKVMQASFARNRDAFVEQWGHLMAPGVLERLDDVQQRCPEISAELVAAPWTLLHGDYRLDNVLFRPNGELVVIDYQLVTWGRAGYDVAYFITTALLPEHRPEERALLTVYHDALVEAGVTDYPFDELLADCERSKGLLAQRFVGAGDTMDTDVEGYDASFLDRLASRVLGWISPA